MGMPQRIKRCARIVPGVGGYQDREALRDADKGLRSELAASLERASREIEDVVRGLADHRDSSLSSLLERISSGLLKVANLLRYAGRGYRGVFDSAVVDLRLLEELAFYDLTLSGDVEEILDKSRALRKFRDDRGELTAALHELGVNIEELENKVLARQSRVTARKR